MTKDEISKSVNRSRADVDNHLIMLEAGDDVIQAISNGEVAATEVQKAMRQHGSGAQERIMGAVRKSRETGSKARLKAFTKKHHDKVMEILAGMDATAIGAELSQLVELWVSDKTKGAA